MDRGAEGGIRTRRNDNTNERTEGMREVMCAICMR